MGLVIPLWIWLPVVMWFLWRYERRKRIWTVERVRAVREEASRLEGIFGEPVLLEEKDRMVAKPRKEMEMKGLIIVGVFGILAAFVYAWEPAPQVVQTPVEAPAAVQVPPNVPPPPPGMVYDSAHNSYHYPAMPQK
jgi:hypothetical protein